MKQYAASGISCVPPASPHGSPHSTMTVEKPNQYDTHLGGVEMSEDMAVGGGRWVK